MVIPYITPADIRMRLTNIGAGVAVDARLAEWCIEVTDVVNTELGFSFDGYDADTERILFSFGLPYLYLPPHLVGSVTAVVWGQDTTPLTDWQELTDGKIQRTLTGDYPRYPYAWGTGYYTVTADWGYGEAPPAVKKVCAELATNTERTKDKGLFTDIIGIEGQGGLRYIGGFTKEQQHILNRIKAKYNPAVFA